MGSMHEDELIAAGRQFHVQFQHFEFIAGIFVQADFANAQDVRAIKKLRNECDDLASQRDVFGFLRVNAKPAEMWQSKFGRSLRLMLSELGEVIKKTGR